MLDYSFDRSFLDKGYAVVCGVDEAGRGPLCGPVVAAACVLPADCVIEGLDDSKKLTEKKREKLYDVILEKALACGIAEASPEEIDEINILNAALLAMRRAIALLGEEYAPDLVLVDGNQTRGFEQEAVAVVHGDAVSQSIAAASVLAKVTRDRMCEELEREYPGYGIGKHKGYPTKDHKLAVYRLGPSPCHRKSFLAFLERDKEKLAAWDEAEKKSGAGHG